MPSVLFADHLSHAKATHAVVIAQNDWTSQRVLSIVVGNLLQRLDIPHRYLDISVDDQWGAIKRGQVDVQIEVWQGTMEAPFEALISSGLALDAGSHDAKTREEWWYPEYVASLCPGLPDWQALKNCALIFAEQDSNLKGNYYTGPWDHDEGKTIRALELNFNVVRSSYDQEHWRNLLAGIRQQKPVILFNWTPNWTDTRLRGHFVEFPDFHPDCAKVPDWGSNPELTHDCGNPKDGWLKKVTSLTFKNNFACGWDLIKRINFTTAMVSEAAALVVIDHLPEKEAAIAWMQKFSVEWTAWLTNSQCYRSQ